MWTVVSMGGEKVAGGTRTDLALTLTLILCLAAVGGVAAAAFW